MSTRSYKDYRPLKETHNWVSDHGSEILRRPVQGSRVNSTKSPSHAGRISHNTSDYGGYTRMNEKKQDSLKNLQSYYIQPKQMTNSPNLTPRCSPDRPSNVISSKKNGNLQNSERSRKKRLNNSILKSRSRSQTRIGKPPLHTAPVHTQPDNITVTTNQSTAYNKNVVQEVRNRTIAEKKNKGAKQALGSHRQPVFGTNRPKKIGSKKAGSYTGNNGHFYNNDSNLDSPYSVGKRSETVTR
jgi:hypothetical protein